MDIIILQHIIKKYFSILVYSRITVKDNMNIQSFAII